MKRPIPTHIRQMNADMAFYRIGVRELSRKARVGYSDTSRILNGWLTHPEKIAKLQATLGKLKGVAV